jgi:hypothetical protein
MTFFSFDLGGDLPPQDMSQYLGEDEPDFLRSSSAVQSPISFPPGIKKSKWTPEEDALLSDSVHEHGITNWTLVAHSIPGRSGKQCRERWMNQLCPSLNKENWTQQEDIILLQQQRIYGNVWSQVAHFLPGRSANAIKNRWGWLSRHRIPSVGPPRMPFPTPNLPVPVGVDQTAPPDLLWGMQQPQLAKTEAQRFAFSDPAAAPGFSFLTAPHPNLPMPILGRQHPVPFAEQTGGGTAEPFEDANPFAALEDGDADEEAFKRFDEWARF